MYYIHTLVDYILDCKYIVRMIVSVFFLIVSWINILLLSTTRWIIVRSYRTTRTWSLSFSLISFVWWKEAKRKKNVAETNGINWQSHESSKALRIPYKKYANKKKVGATAHVQCEKFKLHVSTSTRRKFPTLILSMALFYFIEYLSNCSAHFK